MRVYRINAVYGQRSTGRTALELDEAVRKSGGDARCAFAVGAARDGCYLIPGRFSRKIHAFLARFFGNAGYYSRRTTKKLLCDIEAFSPDVVHLHNLHSNFVCVPMLLAFLAAEDIPTVVTLHDCWFYTGKCCHYTVSGCKRWQFGCGRCPRLRRDIPSLLFDRTHRCLIDKRYLFGRIKNLAVVGVSDWMTNEARKSILQTARIIRRIYNWVDQDVFFPHDTAYVRQKMGLEGYQVILGVASSWSAAKGLEAFVALSELLDKHQIIVLVGTLSSNLCLPPNVLVSPNTNRTEQLSDYYAMADVCISFSPEESFGKSTAEALSCGTPVIVMNSTASPELVGDGCGFVIENGDLNAVKKAVDEIDRLGKDDFSDSCRTYAQLNFDKNAGTSRYLDLYGELAAGRAADSERPST